MSLLSQFFPPSPTFTERSLPDLHDKVILITGATSGIGLALTHMLYSHNATVYLTGRDTSRLEKVVDDIRAAHPASKGRLEPLVLELGDLGSVKKAVGEFVEREGGEARLHVLVQNAGVMRPPAGSRTKSGHDLEMGTNCLGPFLLARLLEPVLRSTAAVEPPNSVRVLWVGSLVAAGTPKGGVVFDEEGSPKVLKKPMDNYMQSKAGAVFLAAEIARRVGGEGVLSVSLHPGIIKTELQRHMAGPEKKIIGLISKPAKFGAYTELYVGFSPDVKAIDNGSFFIPWGRHGTLPADLVGGIRSKSEGGSGTAKRFYEWCERETASYE